jgi:hypothetical protein
MKQAATRYHALSTQRSGEQIRQLAAPSLARGALLYAFGEVFHHRPQMKQRQVDGPEFVNLPFQSDAANKNPKSGEKLVQSSRIASRRL